VGELTGVGSVFCVGSVGGVGGAGSVRRVGEKTGLGSVHRAGEKTGLGSVRRRVGGSGTCCACVVGRRNHHPRVRVQRRLRPRVAV
jgi:hypothetical protein